MHKNMSNFKSRLLKCHMVSLAFFLNFTTISSTDIFTYTFTNVMSLTSPYENNSLETDNKHHLT